MSFIAKHWRGKTNLWVGFWLVGVAPMVLIRVLEPHWLTMLPLDQRWAVPVVLAYVGIVLFVLFPWQAIGVLRSAFAHFEQYGKSHILYSVQAAVIAGGIAAASHGLYTVQRLTGLVDDHRAEVAKQAEQRPVIKVSSSDSSTLTVTGDLQFGITKDVRQVLSSTTGITTVVLDSGGGQIYEGRGLALLFKEQGLNTHVQTQCSSSCTTAFIGGAKRSLANGAKLGFHQYSLDANRSRQRSNTYDTKSEQTKDAELFAEQGVTSDFISIMFAASSDDMWFPDAKQLLEAAVIHEVTD